MIKIFNRILLIFTLIFISENLNANFKNSILVKVGDQIITSIEVEHEIRTLLLINKREVTQEEVNKLKQPVIKSLIKRAIQESEIKKYDIKNFNKNQLDKYLSNIAKLYETDLKGLNELFLKNNLDFNYFVEKVKVNLLWNTLIYRFYANQININPIEIQMELDSKKTENRTFKNYRLSEIELSADSFNSDKLTEIYKYISENSFRKAVEEYSISETRVNMGDIGWVEENSLSASYLEKLKSIKKGDVSEPIKIENSITILKIVDIKIIKNKDLDSAKLKEKIIERKKQEKLSMYARSHYNNLENKTLIKFQ